MNRFKLTRTMLALVLLAQLCTFNLQVLAQIRNSSTRETPSAFVRPALVKQYQQMIEPRSLASRLYFLASDFFEGRETTTRGQKLAALYLASQYRQLGLSPKGTSGIADTLSPAAYFQPFTVYQRAVKGSRLEVSVNGSQIASSVFSAETHDDLSFFQTGNRADASGDGLVFAGYGIADDQLGYNDYAALKSKGITLDGKWVMMLEDEPLADAATSLLPTPEHKPSSWTQFINKRRALWNAGRPAGVLVVKDSTPTLRGTFADEAAKAALNARGVGALSLAQTNPFPPVYAISTKLANQILSSSSRTVQDLQREINRSLKPTVFEMSNVHINSTVEPFKGLETENVLAFVEGSDAKLKDEVVVISAHYDHLGVNPSLTGDQIFNGAADDGSGVVACLEMAQAFMRAKQDGFGPRRSILFVNFSGEEKGLLGSTYYANTSPLIPLEKTVAAINMDGVGGIDLKHPSHSRNYIYINGEKNLSDELIETNRRIKSLTGSSVELTDGPGFSSDNRSFSAQLIPFIYYSTGLTEHYHTPSDEAETIDYEHLARVVQLIFATTWQVANQDARPASVNRSSLTLLGYSCPPCRYACDDATYEHDGECPVCSMPLAPKYKLSVAASPAASK